MLLQSLVPETVSKSGMCTAVSVEIEIIVQSLSTSSYVVFAVDTVRICFPSFEKALYNLRQSYQKSQSRKAYRNNGKKDIELFVKPNQSAFSFQHIALRYITLNIWFSNSSAIVSFIILSQSSWVIVSLFQ